MNALNFIGWFIPFVFTISSVVGILYFYKRSKQAILRYLFFVVFYLNIIWYFGLSLQLSKSFSILNRNPWVANGLEITLSTALFISRFAFLLAFFQLLEQILNRKFLKPLLPSLKITALVISSIWILGWFELPLLGTKGVVKNLMIYTDILIFIFIIAGSIYLFYQANSIPDKLSQTIIKALSLVFIVPIFLAILKWLIGNSLNNNPVLERMLLHVFVFLINGFTILWLVIYTKNLKSPFSFHDIKDESGRANFITKYNISNRELDIILLICEGKTNKEIADFLFISVDTVKDHNNNIFKKTEVKNRFQLAKLYYDIINKNYSSFKHKKPLQIESNDPR